MTMNLEKVNQFIAKVNLVIAAFNEGRKEEIPMLRKKMLEAALEDGVDYHNRIRILTEIRSLIIDVDDVEGINAVDEILAEDMGDGISQVNTKVDIELRRLGNQIISAFTHGRRDELQSAFAQFFELCDQDPGISYVHKDVTEGLLRLARELNDIGIINKMLKLDARVYAQAELIKSNKAIIPILDFEAIDYPSVVTVETFMKCNARCGFCPYPDMEENSDRAGVRLPRELFDKLIDDLCDIPQSHSFMMNLSRVNEPLLDSRLFDFLDIIRDRLPNVSVFLPTNGSTLTEKNVLKLASYKNFFKLMVSLNACEAQEYADVMGLDFERTIKKLDRMHELMEQGKIGFGVVLTTVMPKGEHYEEFRAWCRNRYPKFNVDRYPPTDWFGDTDTKVEQGMSLGLSCKDFYQLHILADGREAQCCFDGEGRLGEGNIKDMHALDIYNKSWQRRIRKFGASRSSKHAPDYCRTCYFG